MNVTRFWPEGSGWRLDVRRHSLPDRLDRELRPVLLIPGYCMNTTPLGYHPEGPSMIEYLNERGFEVWTANLRGQGDTQCLGGTKNAGFRELALLDLPLALEQVQAATESCRQQVDVVGCSLGGTYVFSYLAHHARASAIGSVVGMGAPLRWSKAHPLLRVAFASAWLASSLPVSGTRRMAGLALPFIANRFPSLLSIYMNASIVDLSCAAELVKTVEDPIPKLNGEIARWFKTGDLTVAGVNVTQALSGSDRPYLCVVANRDGIVPAESAKSALDVFSDAELLEVGDDEAWFAHADMFISRHAQERVFSPIARWLAAHQG
jgi:alpha-beta hydrolase superfamily lysophospholipase